MNPDAGTQVMLIYNEKQVPLCILKTFSFKASQIEGLKQAKAEFKIASELGAECENIARGLDIREYKDEDNGTNNVEILFEYGVLIYLL